MRRWIGSALVQIMACRLFGAKPLSKPMMSYCQLDPREQTSMKFQSKYKTFIHEMHMKITSVKWRPSCPGGDELSSLHQHGFVSWLGAYNWCLGTPPLAKAMMTLTSKTRASFRVVHAMCSEIVWNVTMPIQIISQIAHLCLRSKFKFFIRNNSDIVIVLSNNFADRHAWCKSIPCTRDPFY